MPSVQEVILHCQRQIKKDPPAERVLHYLDRLTRLKITVNDLAETGIGRTVNQLSRAEGHVGHQADKLVRSWKAMVAEQERVSSNSESDDDDDEEGNDEDEDEPEVPNIQAVHVKANGHTSSHRSDENEDVQQYNHSNDIPNGHSKYNSRRASYDSDEGENNSDSSIHSRNQQMNVHVPNRVKHESSDSDSDESSSSSDSDGSDRLCIADEPPAPAPPEVLIHNGYSNGKILPSSSESGSDSEVPTPDLEFEMHKAMKHQTDERTLPVPVNNIKLEYESSHNKRYQDTQVNGHSNAQNNPFSKDREPRRNKESNHENDSQHHHRSDGRSRDEKKGNSHHEHDRDRHSNHTKIKHEKEDRYSKSKDHGKVESLHLKTRDIKQEKPDSSSSNRHSHSHHRDRDFKSGDRPDRHSSHSKESKRDEKHSSQKSLGSSGADRSSRDSNSKHHSSERHSTHKVDREREKHKDRNERSGRDKDHRHDHKDSRHHKHKESSKESTSNRKRSPSPTTLNGQAALKKIKTEPIEPASTSSQSSQEFKVPSKSQESKPKNSSSSKKSKLQIADEIDSSAGINFADVLGSLGSTSSKSSKKKEKEKESHDKKRSTNDASATRGHRVSHYNVKKEEPKEKDSKSEKRSINKHKGVVSIIEPISTISPNYKPSTSDSSRSANRRMVHEMPPPPPKRSANQPVNIDDALEFTPDVFENYNSGPSYSDGDQKRAADTLSSMMSSRNQRTKVFSGNKICGRSSVPRLFDMCIEVIQNNINDLGYTGGVPYEILRPALEKATAAQLSQIEEYNSYLIEDTDELWMLHCKIDCKGFVPQEFESWRELYMRAADERRRKLESVTNRMKKKVQVAEPVRKVKLAYVESFGGPRFSKSKTATIANGMKTLKFREEKSATGGSKSFSGSAGTGGSSSSQRLEEAAVVIGAGSKSASAPAPSAQREPAKVKPRRAPLMAKTMKLIRTIRRR